MNFHMDNGRGHYNNYMDPSHNPPPFKRMNYDGALSYMWVRFMDMSRQVTGMYDNLELISHYLFFIVIALYVGVGVMLLDRFIRLCNYCKHGRRVDMNKGTQLDYDDEIMLKMSPHDYEKRSTDHTRKNTRVSDKMGLINNNYNNNNNNNNNNNASSAPGIGHQRMSSSSLGPLANEESDVLLIQGRDDTFDNLPSHIDQFAEYSQASDHLQMSTISGNNNNNSAQQQHHNNGNNNGNNNNNNNTMMKSSDTQMSILSSSSGIGGSRNGNHQHSMSGTNANANYPKAVPIPKPPSGLTSNGNPPGASVSQTASPAVRICENREVSPQSMVV